MARYVRVHPPRLSRTPYPVCVVSRAYLTGVVQVLCLGGTFVVKMFMGSETGNYKSYLSSRFERVCSAKPR